jgi:hypothetical protein
MKYDSWKQGRIFIFFSGGVEKIQGGGGDDHVQGRSRVFDDRFTRFTQLIGGSVGMPLGKILKFGV